MRKRPSAFSASDPSKKNGEVGRTLLTECETLPLPQGGGKTPSQGNVIEAEIPDASGRPVEKVLLEALEVNPTEKIRNFRKSGLHGSCRYGARGLRRSGSWYGEGPEGVHVPLCIPQEPGRCEETRAAPHIGKWSVVPGEADRGVGGTSVERSEMTETGQGPEIAEAGPALFASMDGEGLGAQVATLAGELGLDPPARPMEGKSLSAPRSPRLGSRSGGRSPRGGEGEPSGGKKA